jgi:hypothetical protein
MGLRHSSFVQARWKVRHIEVLILDKLRMGGVLYEHV